MKKKLTALFLVVLIASTIFATPVLATTSDTSPDTVKTQLQSTADYYASQVLSASSNYSDAQVCEMYYDIFLLSASDITGDSDYQTLKTKFINAVSSNISSNGVLLDSNGYESAELYCGVIMTLKAMREDPAAINNNDIVAMFNNFLSSYTGFSTVTNPYYLVNILSVLEYYKDSITDAQSHITDAIECIKSFYYSNGKTDSVDVTSSNIEYLMPSYSSILSGYSEGTFTGFTPNDDGDYYISYGYYMIDSNSSNDNSAALLDDLTDDAGATVSANTWNMLTCTSFVSGSGFYYYGFAIDNDAKMIQGLYPVYSSDTESTGIINSSITRISDSIDSNYQVDGFGYGACSDSTAYALAALSLYEDSENAANLYEGLLEFLDSSTNGFLYNEYSSSTSLISTKNALEGMIQYYDFLTDNGSLFEISTYDKVVSTSVNSTLTTSSNVTYNVSINSNSSIIPSGATMTVSNITDEAVLANAKAVAKAQGESYDNIFILDINLMDGSTQMHQLNGYVEVTIDIPEGMSATGSFIVYRLADDGSLVKLETSVVNGKIVFRTDHFSRFVVAESSSVSANTTSSGSVSTTAVNTGDSSFLAIYITTFSVAAVALIVMNKRKKAV